MVIFDHELAVRPRDRRLFDPEIVGEAPAQKIRARLELDLPSRWRPWINDQFRHHPQPSMSGPFLVNSPLLVHRKVWKTAVRIRNLLAMAAFGWSNHPMRISASPLAFAFLALYPISGVAASADSSLTAGLDP